MSKNKQKNGGQSGLGLYNLRGEQIQYIAHDHANTGDDNQLLNGNYKIASLQDILALFPQLHYKGYIHDPRR